MDVLLDRCLITVKKGPALSEDLEYNWKLKKLMGRDLNWLVYLMLGLPSSW